jgi:DNA-binding MarR family transcriptional regulator
MTEDPLPDAYDPDLYNRANPIRRSLSDVARRMRSLRADHGVSAAKLSVLGQLLRAGAPLTATDLAALERLQPQSLTRIIADLDEQGFITRRQSEKDRRQIEIGITAAGTALMRRDAHRQNLWLAQAMAERLTPAERAMLDLAAELLDRLADQPAEPITGSQSGPQ